MQDLRSRHLTTLTFEVGLREMQTIGVTYRGLRRVAPILAGRFEGERLNGAFLPGGADWVINRPDGVMMIDVRATLKTDDKALIYLTYQGLFRASPKVMQRFGRGEMLESGEYSLITTPRFETGAPAYAWLNDLTCVGVGEQTAAGAIYTLHEVY